MLINDLFEIIEISHTGNKIISKIKLNAAHKIYGGHFPGNPITPGVVQIEIVKEILESVYKKELKLSSMSRCKFLKILNPNETPFVTIDIAVSENPLHVSASGTENEIIYFKLSAVFSDEPLAN
ncbi:MAG: 3-hydroxyacyl-ACP dehydratase [Bacteroidia bacterium]|nr:3-hydroxyacyl-ACP dehydratase [Bacteroidia bacterium]